MLYFHLHYPFQYCHTRFYWLVPSACFIRLFHGSTNQVSSFTTNFFLFLFLSDFTFPFLFRQIHHGPFRYFVFSILGYGANSIVQGMGHLSLHTHYTIQPHFYSSQLSLLPLKLYLIPYIAYTDGNGFFLLTITFFEAVNFARTKLLSIKVTRTFATSESSTLSAIS